MDFIDRLTGNAPQVPVNLFKFTSLDTRIQNHLVKVYATLACATLFVAAGAGLHMIIGNVGGILTALASMGLMIYIMSDAAKSQNERYAALAGFSLCHGASLGPLVQVAADVHPAVLLTAVLATASVFVCFTAAALITKRRSYLFLGGWLSSAVSALAMLQLAGWMFPVIRRLSFEAELFVGIIVFAGYIIYDTQLIVEKAGAGDMNNVRQAMSLLVNVVALFVRILVVLLRKSSSDDDEQARGRDRRSKRR